MKADMKEALSLARESMVRVMENHPYPGLHGSLDPEGSTHIRVYLRAKEGRVRASQTTRVNIEASGAIKARVGSDVLDFIRYLKKRDRELS